MATILLHPVTKNALIRTVSTEHHAIALVGPYGAGKLYTANWLISRLLAPGHKPQQLLHIKPKNESISIDDIRSITFFLRLKALSEGVINRIILIEDSHLLTLEAQNALLKLLEEPPLGTKFILTMADNTTLRQTVYSRLLFVHINPCAYDEVVEYISKLSNKFTEDSIRRAYILSGGYMGLCCALLEQSEHQLVNALDAAKKFVTAGKTKRLLVINEILKDSENLMMTIYAMKRIFSASIHSSKNDADTTAMANRLNIVYLTEQKLKNNANQKLLLTNLALQL